MTDIHGERSRLAAQGLDIIHRETWGARQSYSSARPVAWPADYLFLHITVTAAPAPALLAEYSACRTIEAIGQARFGIGWSYNAGVMQSGRLYEGQPLTRRGAHTVNDKPNPNLPRGSLNGVARACALVQNVDNVVTDAQIDSAARWGAALRRSGEARKDARWYGHRDVTAKSCPGPIGYARLPELQQLTDHYVAVGLGPIIAPPLPLEDEMPFPTFHVSGDATQYRRAITSMGPVDVPNDEYHSVLVELKVIKESVGVNQRQYDVVTDFAARFNDTTVAEVKPPLPPEEPPEEPA